MVFRCQWEESGRVFLPTVHRKNYKREKMERPHPKTAYGSRFYLQNLTLGEVYSKGSIAENFTILVCR